MDRENAELKSASEQEFEEESFDFDELEEKLQAQLEAEFSDLEFLKEEKGKIGSPENLGNVVMDVIWDQLINQVAIGLGAEAADAFIKENNGLTLDLRSEAHIQTTENFENGKVATHNTKIDYQERYDDWQSNFVKDENGNIATHTTRSNKQEATLVSGARAPFDKGRPKGSAEKQTDMDHTVPAAEIIRDPAANAHMTKAEQIAFANSEANLNEIDRSLNRSKGDKATTEWLDNPNARGQKPNEIFDISDEDDKKLRQKDVEAREEYEKQKKEGEKKSIVAGKQSQKEEAFRIGGHALRAVLMQLLVGLMQEIMTKLIKWFKSAKKGLNTLLDSLEEAIRSFVGKLKTHLINAGNTVFSTVMTAIVGPVLNTIKRAWALFHQGFKALSDAIVYLRSPESRGKPIGRLLCEVGKIIVAGLTGVGAMLLSEVVETGLSGIPIFAFEIPLLGSLANILGIFFGSVVAGIIGAIAINFIERKIEKDLKAENVGTQIGKGNEILGLQRKVQILNEEKLEFKKNEMVSNMQNRYTEVGKCMKKSAENIEENCALDTSIQDGNDANEKMIAELGGW